MTHHSSQPYLGMRRQTFFRILVAGIIALLGLLAFLALQSEPNQSPTLTSDTTVCVTRIAGPLEAAQATARLQPLKVERLGDFGQIETISALDLDDACTISVLASPPVGAATVDWRIGISVDEPIRYAGKTVQFTFNLAADREMIFPSSEFYVYDGVKVSSARVPDILLGETTPATLQHAVSPDVNALEFWLRLVSPNTPGNRILIPGVIKLQSVEMAVINP